MTDFGTPHRHVHECGSTNDLARAWALDTYDPAPHGALVSADFQTAGRGRRGRRWDAPADESALMSFVLRPQIAPAAVWHLGFLVSLAGADALRDLGFGDARLKWPNDVLLHGAKVAGVLVETVLAPEAVRFVVAGIGLNVNQSRFEAEDYAYPPTSLRLVTGRVWPVADIRAAVTAALGQWDTSYRRDGFAPVLAAWQEHLAVGAVLRRGAETAALEALTPQGHARVRRDDGTLAEWTALE
jgi:BirA family biotin operon repressor/biotin-[acetyl-CoA-carboxylase] ligase